MIALEILVDTDIPLIIRLYVNISKPCAEATIRGGGGDLNTAVTLVNQN